MNARRTFWAVLCLAFLSPALAMAEGLPEREGPRPKTTTSVPHVQINVQPDPAISAEMLRRVATIPGVDVRGTIISMPGADGFWLSEELELAHPEVIVGGREFAHHHPDGSLHASLEPVMARRAVAAGWAVRHPWADRRADWEGFVMIYTPRDTAELDVVMGLIVGGYNYITGQELALDGY